MSITKNILAENMRRFGTKNLLKEDEQFLDKNFASFYKCLVQNTDILKRWKKVQDNFKYKSSNDPNIIVFQKTIKDWANDPNADYNEKDMTLTLKIVGNKSTSMFESNSTCILSVHAFYRTNREYDSSMGHVTFSKEIKQKKTFKVNDFDCTELQNQIDSFIAQFDKYKIKD